MARCKDCIHENVCSALIEKGLPWNDGEYPAEAFCMAFRNTADVAPRAAVDFLKKTIVENAQKALEVTLEEVENAKREVAREIFEEIETALNLYKCYGDSGIYYEHYLAADIEELKKKYTEGQK